MIRETKLACLFCVVLLLSCCCGCGSSSEDIGPSDPTGRPLAENLKEVVDLSKELEFCLSEGAGINMLQSTLDRMVSVLDVLPDAVEAADLSDNDRSKLADAVEKMQDACQETGMDSESAFRDLCKELRKPLKDLTRISAG